MNNNEKILKALEDLQTGQKALQANVTAIKDVQQKQGKRLESLEAGQKTVEADVKGLHGKVDTVELKVEAVHAYQKQAHNEIMEHLIDSNEVNGQAQTALEQRIDRIEKHLGLPPLK